MSKFKVAYVINDTAFFVSHRLPLALSVIDQGGSVIVITGKNVNQYLENEAINVLKNNNIMHKCCLFSQGFQNPLFEIIGLIQLIYFLKLFKPTTVHSATSKGNFMAVISLNFIKNSKLVMSVSGLGTMFTGKIDFKKKLFLLIYKLILKFCLLRKNYNIIFQNHDDFNQFKSILNFKSNKAVFVPGSGVNTEKMSPTLTKTKDINILLPARMLYEKGINEFVEAARIIKSRKIDAKFYLVGDNISLNPSRIEKEGIITYLDYQQDMKSLYHKMTIICLPSWREGFPKVLMEAASYGIPTVTTDVPGCRDAIIDKKTGFLVPLRSPISIANKIEILIKNKNLQKKMGKAGRILALSKFDLKVIVPQIVKLYE